MSSNYLVKGSSISSKFEFVRQHSGRAAEDLLRKQFTDQDRLFPILDSAWYPFELYDRVNRTIARLFFGGDLSSLEEVGIFSAERVLNTVYKSFIIGDDGHSAEIIHSGAPNCAEADLYIASGFYRGAGRALGLDDVHSEFRLTADGAQFQLEWR
jgi:hypothetical protein